MDIIDAVPAKLQMANELGGQSPGKPLVKVEHSSSPPPLIEDMPNLLEDGENHENQEATSSLRSELQLSTLEYSALNDRFKRLERQHSELQDLATAYSEVIRGLSPTENQDVPINQLQAESGHDGLRAKALEADVLRPLIREAGGLQALVSQIHTMRTLIDKAGGLRELEVSVSDLRTIRDILDELRGSQGLGGLAAEVRDLLTHKQQHAELKSQVDKPNGLRVKAAKYEKLMEAFTDVQTDAKHWQQSLPTSTGNAARATTNSTQPARNQQSSTGPAAMNPARARLISATPLEVDPDRDLYEPAPPVAKPLNRTGSNNTPLGTPQVQSVAELAKQAPSFSTLKRKGTENTASGDQKRPRVNLDRASALVQATLPLDTKQRVRRGSGQSNAFAGGPDLRNRAQPSRSESESTVVGDVGSRPRMQTAAATLKMPDWMRADVRFGDVGFTSSPTAHAPTHSSAPSSQDVEPRADTRSGSVRLGTAGMSVPSSLLAAKAGAGVEGRRAPQMGSTSSAVQDDDLKTLKALFKHPVALWVGSTDAYASSAWDAYQSYDLKRDAQIPDELLVCLLNELVKYVNMENLSTYEQMLPSRGTCIVSHVLGEYRSAGLPQERRACQACTSAWAGQSRPCALLQDVNGVRTIIFLPLGKHLRSDKRWSDKAYWVRAEQ
ncbi:hypothetical protein M3J09_006495 [Ascochyta lentis]